MQTEDNNRALRRIGERWEEGMASKRMGAVSSLLGANLKINWHMSAKWARDRMSNERFLSLFDTVYHFLDP